MPPSIANIVLDANAFLSLTSAALRALGDQFYTTKDVLSEIKDKQARGRLENFETLLGAAITVKQPSAEAITQVTSFARATGDISVLSSTDIRLCALLYTIQVEKDGHRCIRPAFGKPSEVETVRQKRREQRRERRRQKREDQASAPGAQIQLDQPDTEIAGQDDLRELPVAHTDRSHPPYSEQTGKQVEIDRSDDSDGGEWITPDNIKAHKKRSAAVQTASIEESEEPVAVGCMTSDFAMQNVIMQMGLHVVGTDGMKIKQVKTWVLRCHACFKICKNPIEKFCPSCGNHTLLRTSVTYLDFPSPEHPQGYILHLKRNFQYRNRGTIFSAPSPLSQAGASKRSNDDTLIFRPDQKEYLRGVHSYEISKKKEEKRALQATKDGTENRLDLDWLPSMLLGEKGRSNRGQKQRTGKDGMPVIGFGKKNPNAVGRKPV